MQQANRRTLLKGGLLSIAGMVGLPSLRAAVELATIEYRRPKLKITAAGSAPIEADFTRWLRENIDSSQSLGAGRGDPEAAAEMNT